MSRPKEIDAAKAAALVAPFVGTGGSGPLELLGEGDFCFAFRAGDRVVRVAKHDEAARAIEREACLLARVADDLPLAVPRLAFTAAAGAPPFTVHEAIAGDVLTRARWEALPAEARSGIARVLADFLARLHGAAEAVAACGLPRLDGAAMAQRLRSAAPTALHGQLDAETLRRLEAFLDARSQTPTRSPLALLHGDLAPGHLLYDPATAHLTGVIDFGDAVLGSAARDFIFLYEDFGLELCNEVAQAYASEHAPAFREEVRAWYLLEALDWTLSRRATGSEEAFEHGLAEIRRELEA